VVNFRALLEFGLADVAVRLASYQPQQQYERVVAVPFHVTSGRVVVDGPEESRVERGMDLPQGHYRLVAASGSAETMRRELTFILNDSRTLWGEVPFSSLMRR
jgi:hypothetical protein